MLVKEVMSKNPVFLEPTSTIQEAIDKMIELDCGFIPVGENDRLIGTITDRDIIVNASKQNMKTSSIKEVMSDSVVYCFEEDEVEKAAKRMGKNQIHRLIVLNKNKRFTGVLSIGDIARKTKDVQLCGKVLEEISKH